MIEVTAPAAGARIASAATGLCVLLGPGETRAIHDSLAADAFALGCTPVAAPDSAAAVNPEDRLGAIRNAVEELISRGNPVDFSKDGAPKLSAVTKAVGFECSKSEVDTVYAALVAG